MFSRAAVSALPAGTRVRGMATLRDINSRLKAVTNIQKITKSMKVVAAAKYNRAEKELKPAKTYGEGSLEFYDKAAVAQDEKAPQHLIVALSSDRGLCGAIHGNVFRAIRGNVPNKAPGTTVKFIAVGDKQKTMLQRLFRKDILMHFADLGKKPPTFGDASVIAESILGLDYEYDFGELYFNKFRSIVAYDTTILPIFNAKQIDEAENLSQYDSLDADVLQSYREFSLSNQLYLAMKEGACSEQSSRMTSMDAATKNAGEMIDRLRLLYNRKRQSVITTELIEIISGAAALE